LIVLDAWALVAYFKGEPAAGRIETAWLDEGATISSINLGEVFYGLIRKDGQEVASTDLKMVQHLLEVVDPDWPTVEAAAKIKAGGGLSYPDAFCIATAQSIGAPIWTGDPEIVTQAATHSCAVVDLRD
jgi:predicted nucleic acid-binding protein